jgi:adenosylmethionine-8-amino-7-oxononanoate aminotransferase
MGSISETTFLYQKAYETTAPLVKSASGLYLTLENGQRILDATCGAAVSAIGHGNIRVKDAIVSQLDKLSYAHPGYFENQPALQLAEFLVQSTGGMMARACLLGSGIQPLPPSPCLVT